MQRGCIAARIMEKETRRPGPAGETEEESAMKRIAALLLALALLLSLAACGEGSDAAREAELSFAASAFYRRRTCPCPWRRGRCWAAGPVGPAGPGRASRPLGGHDPEPPLSPGEPGPAGPDHRPGKPGTGRSPIPAVPQRLGGYKTLIFQRGALLLVLVYLICGQMIFLYSTSAAGDSLYDQYCEDMQGPLDASAEDYLAHAREKALGNQEKGQLLSALDRVERRVDALRRRAEEGGYEPWMVRELSYSIAYGTESVYLQRSNAALAVLLTALLTAPLWAYERQAGVVPMARSAAGDGGGCSAGRPPSRRFSAVSSGPASTCGSCSTFSGSIPARRRWRRRCRTWTPWRGSR